MLTGFDAFRDRIAPNVRLTHVVREDWLERALAGLDDTLSAEITNEIRQSDAPICTCTTIGSVAEQAGALRVDQPMMARAAQIGGPVLFGLRPAQHAETFVGFAETGVCTTHAGRCPAGSGLYLAPV